MRVIILSLCSYTMLFLCRVARQQRKSRRSSQGSDVKKTGDEKNGKVPLQAASSSSNQIPLQSQTNATEKSTSNNDEEKLREEFSYYRTVDMYSNKSVSDERKNSISM
jgi:hypothetical protein